MRDSTLINLRPQLNLNTQHSKEMERFQNQTLRPILKFQNDATIKLLIRSQHFIKIRAQYREVSIDKLKAFINNFLTSNLAFRNTLIGSIIGFMTMDELEFYLDNTSEINKRIISMQAERFIDYLS